MSGQLIKDGELLITKLRMPPVRPDLVPRPRLITRLNNGIDLKLTLVSAPAGFGKTTLVSQWVQSLDCPVAWLSLDEGDNDPTRFFSYLIAAFQQVNIAIGGALEVLLTAPQPPPIETLVTVLINDIAMAGEPFVLVLDDFHLVRSPAVSEAITFLLEYQPATLHLAILTREDSMLPLSRLRVRGQITEIRTDDLQFTMQEVTALLNHAFGLGLDAESVRALGERTEGWIVGLQLAALSLQNRENVTQFINEFNGAHHYVIDYLADEVLARQSEEVRTFLQQTAILDRLTAPLCDALTGQSNGRELIRQLEQANLFLFPLDDRREWYRYHPLFADCLRSEIDRATWSALHLKAAQWFEANGSIEEAVKHALESGDASEGARLVTRAAYPMLLRGRLVTLLDWLSILPDDVLLGEPVLAAFKALVLLMTTPSTEAEPYIAAAERGRATGLGPLHQGWLYSMKAWMAVRHGESDAAVHLAGEALELIGDEDIFFRSLTLMVLGQAWEAQGNLQAATRAYYAAYWAGQRHQNRFTAAVALYNLALSLETSGQLHEVVALCQQAIVESGEADNEAISLIDIMYLPMGMVAYRLNDLKQARTFLKRGLAACERYGIGIGVLAAHYVLAQVRIVSGDVRGAVVTILDGRQAATPILPKKYYDVLYAALEAQLMLQQGYLSAAKGWAETVDLSQIGAGYFWSDQVIFTYIRVLISEKRFQEASERLIEIEQSAKRGGRRGSLISCLLLHALAKQAVGSDDEAQDMIQQAVRISMHENYTRAFLDETPAILELLSRARHIAPNFVDQIIAESQRTHTRQTLVVPLTLRQLEVLELIAEGLSNQEIAEKLVTATSTVKKHINHIFAKLDARDRTHAVLRARELGLLKSALPGLEGWMVPTAYRESRNKPRRR